MIPFIILLAIVVFAFYFFSTRNKSKIKAVSEMGIDTVMLENNVSFYAKLDAAGKKKFEDDILYFLKHVAVN
jgi:hypothetical protein